MVGSNITSEIIIDKIPAEKAIILISRTDHRSFELTFVQSLMEKQDIYKAVMDFLQNSPMVKNEEAQLWLKSGQYITNVGKLGFILHTMPIVHVATLILRFQRAANNKFTQFFIETTKINGLKFLSYIPHVAMQSGIRMI